MRTARLLAAVVCVSGVCVSGCVSGGVSHNPLTQRKTSSLWTDRHLWKHYLAPNFAFGKYKLIFLCNLNLLQCKWFGGLVRPFLLRGGRNYAPSPDPLGHQTWDPQPWPCTLLVTSGGHNWRPVKTCSLEDPLPTSADIWWMKDVWLASGRCASYGMLSCWLCSHPRDNICNWRWFVSQV